MFIVFEGLDGVGKTTQAQLLADWFKSRGREVWQTRQPGGCSKDLPFSARSAVMGESGLDRLTVEYLLQADRREHLIEIKEKLAAGQVVISDRSFLSGAAYALAQGIDPELVRTMTSLASPFPDLVIYLNSDPEDAQHRVKERGGEAWEVETLPVQQKVAKHFLDLLWGPPEKTGVPHTQLLVVDASLSRESQLSEITADLLAYFSAGVKEVELPRVESGPISWTPTGSWDAGVTYEGIYRRVGSWAECSVVVWCDNEPSIVDLTINLPTGLTIDREELLKSQTTLFSQNLGMARFDNPFSSWSGWVGFDSPTSVRVMTDTTAIFDNTNSLTVKFVVPISEWSGGIVYPGKAD